MPDPFSVGVPCDQLTEHQLTHRLAELMYVKTSQGITSVRMKSFLETKPRQPGYCVVCGTKLPVTWRATRCDRPPTATQSGQFNVVEADHSPESLAKVEHFNKAHPEDKYGLQNGFLNWPVTSCECLSQEAFGRAKAYLLEERHKAAASKPVDASEERRRKAAQRVGGS